MELLERELSHSPGLALAAREHPQRVRALQAKQTVQQ
jgi:hypothetical protein